MVAGCPLASQIEGLGPSFRGPELGLFSNQVVQLFIDHRTRGACTHLDANPSVKESSVTFGRLYLLKASLCLAMLASRFEP